MNLVRLVPLYASLLLALAAFGALNQSRYFHQDSLIDQKASLQESIAQLRSHAAQVRGPLSVSAWAQANGMVPAPDVSSVRVVASMPSPERSVAVPGLEVRTIWR